MDEHHPRMLLGLLGGIGRPLPEDRLLDLGCGRGAMVAALRSAGVDAWGCDFPEEMEQPNPDEHLRVIETTPYRLPYDDNSFDVAVSWQVFEHVMDLDRTFAENRRILRPGGVALHVFSGRYCLLEPHTYVPLATLIRNRPWLLLWAWIGVRNEFQAGKTAREVADINHAYLRDRTNYPRRRTLVARARRVFDRAEYREDLFIELGTSARSRVVQRVAALSPALRRLIGRVYLVRKYHTRVLVLQ